MTLLPRFFPLVSFVVCCAVPLGLGACGPSLTMGGARVQIAKTTSAIDCHAINDVDGEGANRQKAEIEARNAAGELNANTLVITEEVANGGRIRLHGQAFGCRPQGQ